MSLSSLGQSYCTIDVWSECRVALSLRTVPIKKRVDESLMEVRGSALHSVPLLPFHQSYIPLHEYKGTTALSHRRARDQPDPRLAFHPALDRTKPALHFPHARSRTLVAKSKHNELSENNYVHDSIIEHAYDLDLPDFVHSTFSSRQDTLQTPQDGPLFTTNKCSNGIYGRYFDGLHYLPFRILETAIIFSSHRVHLSSAGSC